MPKKRIPKFKTIQEEAEFWDTHDSMDYLDELDEVTNVRFAPAPKEVMTLRMDKATVDLIKQLAKRLGMRHTAVARMWLVERANAEARTPGPTDPKKRKSTRRRAA